MYISRTLSQTVAKSEKENCKRNSFRGLKSAFKMLGSSFCKLEFSVNVGQVPAVP